MIYSPMWNKKGDIILFLSMKLKIVIKFSYIFIQKQKQAAVLFIAIFDPMLNVRHELKKRNGKKSNTCSIGQKMNIPWNKYTHIHTPNIICST